jgi:serine/threonine protein kinase
MDSPSPAAVPDRPAAGPAPDLVAEDLAAQMADAWQRGERPPAEAFLARHPEVAGHAEAAVRLIYEEVCQRETFGPAASAAEVVGRFPQWRSQIEVLLDCHDLLRPPAPALFPEAGSMLGDFHLQAELGRGALGRVFLATQPALADRPVVLKLTPRRGQEHLSLARLQHTHIVPLYAVQDFPDRNLRGLCMPYLAGATLAQLFERLEGRHPGLRTGRDLLEALQAVPAPGGREVDRAPARKFLARAGYAQAVCWVGACLADGLHYAHERGLVHLDVKPSNVLLAADGQPMLLDFHLAREPVRAGDVAPEWLGGTRGCMSPEQQAGLAAVCEGRPVPADVDRRSDVYALGMLLYEALAGFPPPEGRVLPRLYRVNPEVSPALSDLVRKCLAPDPRRRYARAADLADDLRRHLNDLPLRGVRNRSLAELWGKWRRRRPHALALGSLWLAVLAAALAAGVGGLVWRGQRIDEARAALAEGGPLIEAGEYAEAARTLERGVRLAEGLAGADRLARDLEAQHLRALRGQAARELHALADHIRFLYAEDTLGPAQLRTLEGQCRAVWARRGKLASRPGASLPPDTERDIPEDLQDLALFWAGLHLRLAPEGQDGRREVLKVLAEAEVLGGPSVLLRRQRRALGDDCPGEEPAPRTARDNYVLGRSLLEAGRLPEAAAALGRAVELQPQGFWPNFYQGVCAFRRGRYADAEACFRVCVALAPGRPECYHNRALARAALGQAEGALADCDRALSLVPDFAPALLNRGLLHLSGGRPAAARADLLRAGEAGADPAAVHYNLALVCLAQDDRAGARAEVDRALAEAPDHARARDLRARLRPGREPGERRP